MEAITWRHRSVTPQRAAMRPDGRSVMLKRIPGILVLMLVLTLSPRADASVVDDYAAEAFGETGVGWSMKSFRRLGPYVLIAIVPNRDIGIVLAELTIGPDGELHGVRVSYGSVSDVRKPFTRIR
jgi:hypothetical protein